MKRQQQKKEIAININSDLGQNIFTDEGEGQGSW